MRPANHSDTSSPTGDLYRIFKRKNKQFSFQGKSQTQDEDGQSITSATASAISACELERSSVGIRTYLLDHFSRKQLIPNHRHTPAWKGFEDLLEKEYNLALHADNSTMSDGLGPHLAAARCILLQLRSSFTEPKQTSSRHLQISAHSRRVLFLSVENFLRQKIWLTNSDENCALSEDDVVNRIKLINDLLRFLEQTFPEYNISDFWEADHNALVKVYVDEGVRKHVRALKRAKSLSMFTGDIQQKHTGRVRTSFSAAVTQIIDSRVAAAKRDLSSEYVQVVQAAVNEELCELVDEMLQAIEQSWESLNAKQLCAFINDVDRLREVMVRRNSKYLTRPSFKKQGEIFHNDTIHLSQQASRLLARRIMKELVSSEKILNYIGDGKWEADESRTAAVRMISALKEQFKRFQSFLGDEFPRLLKACFDQSLQLYVETLLRNTLKRRCIARAVAQALEADYAIFLNFYNGDLLDNHFGRKGFYTLQALNFHLHLLKSVANVIQPGRSADEVKQDVQALLRAFEPTDKATRVVLHLVSLNQSCEKFDSTAWLNMIAEAKNENSQEAKPSFSFDTRLEIPFLESRGKVKSTPRQERPVAKCIRSLKKPAVVLRAQSDTVSVV